MRKTSQQFKSRKDPYKGAWFEYHKPFDKYISNIICINKSLKTNLVLCSNKSVRVWPKTNELYL